MKKMPEKTAAVEITMLPTVPTQLDKLRVELGTLKAITETQYKTSGVIDDFNIQTETSLATLITIYASISKREQAYNEAARDLGLNTCPLFTIAGGNSSSWKHDIQLRIAVINHAERKKELEELVKEGESFLTQSDKYALYLAKVAKTVG